MHDLLDQLAPDVDVDAAWEEVSARLQPPTRGRSARVLAVAAAVALVAGGAVLAARSDGGDQAGLPAATAPVPVVDSEVDVTVAVPDGWRHTTFNGEGTPFAATMLLSTMPVHELTDAGICAGLSQLGPADAIVRIDRRSRQRTDWTFIRPTSDITLPEGTEGSAEWGDCEGVAIAFASRAYGIEPGADGVAATVFIGTGAGAGTRADVTSILRSVLPPVLTHRDRGTGVTVEYASSWQVADGQLVAPIRGDPSPQILALGTFAMASDELECRGSSCSARCPELPNRALQAMGPTDALIWVDELLMADIANYPTRPDEFVRLPFAAGDPLPRDCRHHGIQPGKVSFFDGTRAFTVWVVLGVEATDQTKSEALAIMNSLQLQPR